MVKNRACRGCGWGVGGVAGHVVVRSDGGGFVLRGKNRGLNAAFQSSSSSVPDSSSACMNSLRMDLGTGR